MKKILVPVDFSLEADNTAMYAASLAEQLQAQLILLYVFHRPLPVLELPYLPNSEALENENIGLLKQLESEVKKKHQLSIKLVVVREVDVDDILDKIAQEQADLIVMGTHGIENTFHFLSENSALDAKRLSHLPVLVIPSELQFTNPIKILLAFDILELNDPILFQPLNELSKKFGSRITVLNVYKPGELSISKAYLDKIPFDLYLDGIAHELCFEENDNVEDGLKNYLLQFPSDMLVVMPHKYNLIHRLFFPLHSERLTAFSEIPVLVLHDSDKKMEPPEKTPWSID